MKDGGPAFPTNAMNVPFDCTDDPKYQGMSLRDFFAGMALPRLIDYCIHTKQDGTNITQDIYPAMGVKMAYKIADAMIKEREK